MTTEETAREDDHLLKLSQQRMQARTRALFSAIQSPRALLGGALIYGAAGLFYFVTSEQSLVLFLERYGLVLAASVLFLVGFYLFFTEFAKWQQVRESRFVDVDERSRSYRGGPEYEYLLLKVQELQASIRKEEATETSGTKRDVDNGEEGDKNSIRPLLAGLEFVAYFDSIRRLLEEKASVADEKASILLDKGTAYSKFGITFFIMSIVAWQVVAHIVGFKVQFIYGIVSTSILFVFIEFLSAWFLKQYRQFIDTSTYLIKVKSIFDRYMLVYLASKEAITSGHDTKKSNQLLLDLLRADIAWPDTYLTKNPDISFAKEALETMTLLVRSMKSEVKEVATKDSSSASRKRAT